MSPVLLSWRGFCSLAPSTQPSWGLWGKAGDSSDGHVWRRALPSSQGVPETGGAIEHPTAFRTACQQRLLRPQVWVVQRECSGTCQVEGLLLRIQIIDADTVDYLWSWRTGVFLALPCLLGWLVPYRITVSFQAGTNLGLSALQEIGLVR